MRSSASRYWHTIRYLKPVQIYGRVWFRLMRPTPDLRPAPALRPALEVWILCARKPAMLDASVFRFLSATRELTAAVDWNRADWPKLWLYNLHYFDDLNADEAAARLEWHLLGNHLLANAVAAGSMLHEFSRS